MPKTEISMLIASKVIADAFVVGRVYHSDSTAVGPVIRTAAAFDSGVDVVSTVILARLKGPR